MGRSDAAAHEDALLARLHGRFGAHPGHAFGAGFRQRIESGLRIERSQGAYGGVKARKIAPLFGEQRVEGWRELGIRGHAGQMCIDPAEPAQVRPLKHKP